MMSVVKLTNKKELDELVARLTLRLGRKPKQQEVLDICVEIGSKNFEEIANRLNPGPVLDEDLYEQIQKTIEELSIGEWTPLDEVEWGNEEDKDIYGID